MCVIMIACLSVFILVCVITCLYVPFLPFLLVILTIVANDTAVYREMWGDAAIYFEHNDAASLTETLAQLHQDPEMARLYGTRAYNRARERFTARRMVDDYLRLYRHLRTSKVAVA